MELGEAKKIINTFINNAGIEVKTFELKEAIKNMLQELARLQKENEELIKETRKKRIIAPGRRGLTKTYEYGLIVGTKREREYWKNKIRREKEELSQRIKSHVREDEYKKDKIYTCKDFDEFITSVLQDLLKEE